MERIIHEIRQLKESVDSHNANMQKLVEKHEKVLFGDEDSAGVITKLALIDESHKKVKWVAMAIGGALIAGIVDRFTRLFGGH